MTLILCDLSKNSSPVRACQLHEELLACGCSPSAICVARKASHIFFAPKRIVSLMSDARIHAPSPVGSPIFSALQYKHLRRRVQHHIPRTQTLLLIFVVTGVVLFFFASIYLGSSYLQDHLQDERYKNSLGALPNTRNRITKWSQRNLGIDLEQFGAPPRARVVGTGADKAAFVADGDKEASTDAQNGAKTEEVAESTSSSLRGRESAPGGDEHAPVASRHSQHGRKVQSESKHSGGHHG